MRIKQIILLPLLLILLHLMVTSAPCETVKGNIVLRGQSGSAGVGVSIGFPSSGNDAVPSPLYTVFTDEGGSYTFKNVPPLDYPYVYIITASLHGYQNESSDIFRFNAGDETIVDTISLIPDTGLISGVVSLEDADYGDYDDILVVLKDAQVDDRFAVLTSASGRYSFDDIPVGQYTVVASKSGYLDATCSDTTVKANRNAYVGDMILIPEENSMINIKGSVDDIKNQLSSFQYEQDELFNNFDALDNLVAQQKGDITVLKTAVDKFQNYFDQYDIGGLIPEFIALQTAVEKQQSDLDTLEQKTVAAGEDIERTIKPQLQEHESKITALEKNVLKLDSRVEKLEKTVSALIGILEKKYKKEFEAALID